MRTCLGCGRELVRRSQKLYCSVGCWRDLIRQQNLARWLETGEGGCATNTRHYMRRHISEEQGGRCAICDSPPDWNGSPLVLVLDHIDGDSTTESRAVV